jgi:hypothetical protein
MLGKKRSKRAPLFCRRRSRSLAGPKSPQAAEFYAVAEKLMERANAASDTATDVIEIK